MSMFRTRSADAAELFALEHRFSCVAALIGLLMASTVGSTVLMLVGQA